MSTAVIAEQGLARALADAALSRHSGLLTAKRGKHKRLFALEDGQLIFAASNVIEEQFSEALVREGVVAGGDLAAAQLECQREGLPLTRQLLVTGAVPEVELSAAIEAYVRSLLFETLDWSDGQSTFARGRANLADEVTVRLGSGPLIIEYARHHPPSLTDLRVRIGRPSLRLEIDREREELLGGVEMDEPMRYLLGACNGDREISTLIDETPADVEATWRSLYGLLLLAVARPPDHSPSRKADTQTREEIQTLLVRAAGADHYGVLGVSSAAEPQKIRDAYYQLARLYHPDRFRTGPLADLLDQIEGYFSQVTEAYNTLHVPELRRAYDEQIVPGAEERPGQDRAFLARENFRRAQALVLKGRFKDAVTSLDNAIKLDPRSAVYRLEAGRLLGRNPRLREKAIEHLIEANRMDPSLVDGYFELGNLYRKMGREEEAVQLFEETLRWDPDHAKARARLEQSGRS